MLVINTKIEGVGAKSLELEEVALPKLIATFHRCDDYDGKYGFDWYRDYYETQLSDPSKLDQLKKEYTPTKIHDKDYYVPWLALMVGKEAKLKLKFENERLKEIQEKINAENKKEAPDNKEIKKLNKEKDKVQEGLNSRLVDEVILLPDHDGFEFMPNEVLFEDIKDNWECDVTVKCSNAITENTMLDVKLKSSKNIIGYLNAYKNDIINEIPVKIIKVLGNEQNNSYNERVFGSSLKQDVKFHEIQSNIKKLQNELNERYLNQALIQITFDDIEELNIDVEKYIQEKWLNLPNGLSIPQFDPKKIGTPLYDNFLESKGINKYNGIVVFYMAMPAPDLRGGQGNIFPRVPDRIVMPPDQVEAINATSLAHEIGHTLGLHHPFENSFFTEKIEQNSKKLAAAEVNYNNNKQILDNYFNANPNRTHVTSGGVRRTKAEAYEYIKETKNEIQEKLSDYKTLGSYHKYVFNKGQTDFIMDYTIENSPYKRISFPKWQWKPMHEEINYIRSK